MENEVKNEEKTLDEEKTIMITPIEEKKEDKPKRKGHGPLYWVIVIIGMGLIVYLSMGIGEKLGRYAELESGSGNTTKEEANSNENSDTNTGTEVSNSNTNKALTYSIEMSVTENNKDAAIVRAKDNNNIAWEYKTSSYEKTELDTFKLYEGNTYVYVAEAGIVKALDKNTGKVVWASSSNVGQSTDMLEVNGKLYAVGSYQKGLSILNVSNGTLDKEVSINTYTKPEQLKKISDNVISFQAGEVVNGTLTTVTLEYDITTGQLTKK